MLRDLGFALGFEVWIASNDQSRPYRDGSLGKGCLSQLPTPVQEIAGGEAVRLIDVLWLERETDLPAAAFEVEHSTSIYAGIVRMLDLAMGFKEAGDRSVCFSLLRTNAPRKCEHSCVSQHSAKYRIRLFLRSLR